MGGKGHHGSRVLAQQEARHGPHHFISSLAETPTQCHCERLAGDILADVPAGYELLFLFVFLFNQPASLSPERTMLQGNPENHRCFSHVQVWNEEAQLLGEAGAAAPGGTGPLPEVTEGERTREGRSSIKTNGPGGKGYLLNSNGIILFGRGPFAKFLIKESLEAVCFFNKSLN